MTTAATFAQLDPETLRIVLDLAEARLDQQACAQEDSIGQLAVEHLRAILNAGIERE